MNEPFRKQRIKDCRFRLPTRREITSVPEAKRTKTIPWARPYPKVSGAAFFGYFGRAAVGVFPHVCPDYWYIASEAKGVQVCSLVPNTSFATRDRLQYLDIGSRARCFWLESASWFSVPFDRSSSNPLAAPRQNKTKFYADWHWRYSGLGTCVYFVKRSDNHLIKIGTSERLPHRFDALQMEYRSKLEVLGVVPGSYPEETRLHKKFAHLCVRGEWFRCDPELLEFIEANAIKGNTDRPAPFDDTPYPLVRVA